MAIGRADHRVHLPVTNFLTRPDDGGSFGDVPLAGESAAFVGAGVALPNIRCLAQQTARSATSLLVAADKTVDRLTADSEPALERKPAADLIGTEAFTEKSEDQFPVGGTEAAVAAGSRATAVGHFLRSGISVRTVITRAVPGELPSDRAAMAAHEPGNRSDR